MPAHCNLRLLGSSDFPGSVSQVAGITDVSQQAPPIPSFTVCHKGGLHCAHMSFFFFLFEMQLCSVAQAGVQGPISHTQKEYIYLKKHTDSILKRKNIYVCV